MMYLLNSFWHPWLSIKIELGANIWYYLYFLTQPELVKSFQILTVIGSSQDDPTLLQNIGVWAQGRALHE